jgi:hypothetical protein
VAVGMALAVQFQRASMVRKRATMVSELSLELAHIVREQRLEIFAGRGLSMIALGGHQALVRLAIATAVVGRIALQPRQSCAHRPAAIDRVLLPRAQVVDLRLERRQVREVYTSVLEPGGEPATYTLCPLCPLLDRDLVAAHFLDQPMDAVSLTTADRIVLHSEQAQFHCQR